MHKKSMVLLFAYGSLSPDRIKDLVGSVDLVGPGIAKGWRLVFSGAAPRYQNKGTATLTPDETRDVLGLIYDMNCDQIDLLDCWEGAVQGITERFCIQVTDPCGQVYTCFAYRLVVQTGDVPASPEYLRLHHELLFIAADLYRQAQSNEVTRWKKRRAVPLDTCGTCPPK